MRLADEEAPGWSLHGATSQVDFTRVWEWLQRCDAGCAHGRATTGTSWRTAKAVKLWRRAIAAIDKITSEAANGHQALSEHGCAVWHGCSASVPQARATQDGTVNQSWRRCAAPRPAPTQALGVC